MTANADINEVLQELVATNDDYLNVSGNAQLLEFLSRSAHVEEVCFSDVVHKVNWRGNWQERHLIITNKKLEELIGLLISRNSEEVVFKVKSQHDYRFRIVRRSEAISAVCAQYNRLMNQALKVIMAEPSDLGSMTTTKRDRLRKTPRATEIFQRGADQSIPASPENESKERHVAVANVLGATIDLTRRFTLEDVNQSSSRKNHDCDSSVASSRRSSTIKAFTSLFNARTTLDRKSSAPVVSMELLNEWDDVKSSILEGWLAKKSLSSWKRRYMRLQPPNLLYFEPRVRGTIVMADGVITRFPRGDDEQTFQHYLSDPDLLEEFMSYCKNTFQDETLCFIVDVEKFELLPANSAHQFNWGQEIFNQYLRTGAPQEVFVWTELIQTIQQAMATAQDTKILPSTVFNDAKRQVIAMITGESFPRFIAARKNAKRNEEISASHDSADECANCFSRYSITKRRHLCCHCNKKFCGSCTSQEAAIENENGQSVNSRVCPKCHFLLTNMDPNMWAFAYVSRTKHKPVYIATESQESMHAWIRSIDAAIAGSTTERREGWLKKKNSTNSSWRSRYFVLEGPRLWFYEMCFKGSVSITRGVGVHHSGTMMKTLTDDHCNFGGLTSTSNFAYRFILSNSSRVFNLAADSEDEMNKWLEELKRCTLPSNHSIDVTLVDDTPMPMAHFQEAPTGEVAIVFTDIQNSTSLWEKVPDAMHESLEKHDHVLRTLLKVHTGYEVKTEGDAFMVTFFNAEDAVEWCLDVQKALLYTEWPPELLTQTAAAKELDESGLIIMCGIRIRMGIHVGYPTCRRNPVTNRMDYYGPVINRVARISDSAHGGQVICTEEVYTSLQDTSRESLQSIIMKDLGSYPFKGISEPVRIYQVMSNELASRSFPPLRIHGGDKAKTLPALLSSASAPPEDQTHTYSNVLSSKREFETLPQSPIPHPPTLELTADVSDVPTILWEANRGDDGDSVSSRSDEDRAGVIRSQTT